jgi:prepilin-type N-terminal cleavage/methylation domain-containing protein
MACLNSRSPEPNLPAQIRAHHGIRQKHPVNTLSAGFTLVEVIIVILIIGIVFSIAIPVFQQRDNMIKVIQVMNKVEPLRRQVERHILTSGSIPVLPSDVPGAVPVKVRGAAIARLENNGVIVVRFKQSLDGPLAGKTIEVSPIIENDTFSWRCDQGTLPQKYLSSRCWVYNNHWDSNLVRNSKKYHTPSYYDLAETDKVYQTMRKVNALRMKVQEHIVKTTCIPALASEVPGVVPVKVQDTAIAQLENNGVIVVRFNQSLDGPLAGTTIELTPTVKGKTWSWKCDRGTLPSKYRSSRCWIY